MYSYKMPPTEERKGAEKPVCLLYDYSIDPPRCYFYSERHFERGKSSSVDSKVVVLNAKNSERSLGVGFCDRFTVGFGGGLELCM